MLVTPFPIVTEVKDEQSWKALSPIPITLSPMTYSVTCEPNMCDKLESREYCLFTIASELIVTEVKEEQFRKAEPPMLVTLSGIVTDVKEEQPSKA